jgi:hypothetical protein
MKIVLDQGIDPPAALAGLIDQVTLIRLLFDRKRKSNSTDLQGSVGLLSATTGTSSTGQIRIGGLVITRPLTKRCGL